MDWKRSLRKPTLYRVGPYNMVFGDLVKLGFDPKQFEQNKDPMAVQSPYDLNEVAAYMKEAAKKVAQKLKKEGEMGV